MPSPPSSTLERFAEENGVENFLVSFVDLLGVPRAKLVPKSVIREMEVKGAGFAGHGTYFRMSPADPDMSGVPDPDSVIQLPWKPKVAWVACDLMIDGKPVEQGPRQVLKAQIERARAKGLRMKTGVECEFFLLSSAGYEPSDKLDKQEKPGYDQFTLMRRYDVIAELLSCMEALGWRPYQADHEGANGQFEINWTYDDCLRTADQHVFFKFMAKSIAEKHGFKATFMPKLFPKHAGNGAHTHVSLWDLSGKTNLFIHEEDDLGTSKTAYEFMGGILQNAKALTGILTPTVNSFKRTNESSGWGSESMSFTGNNRTHMIRIPEAGRFELRLADGAVNPYLLQAATLACGLHGVENHIDPGDRADYNGRLPPPDREKKVENLPASLLEAIQELNSSTVLRKAFGDDFVDSFLKIQKELWRAYASHLSQWEIDNTIDC